MAQSVEALSHTLKGCGFDSWAGHIPRLQVRFLVPGRGAYGRQPTDVSLASMFLSHIDVFLSLSPPLPLSLSINKHILR